MGLQSRSISEFVPNPQASVISVLNAGSANVLFGLSPVQKHCAIPVSVGEIWAQLKDYSLVT